MNTSKTLLAILVEYLPTKGGWPEKAITAKQSAIDGEIYFYDYSGQLIDRGIYIKKAEAPMISLVTRKQYEAAVLAATTQATITMPADGWIDWAGGERPVDNGVLVEVKYKNEKDYHIKGVNHAGRWSWAHYGTDGDIIAYRLHQPKELEEHAHVGGVTGPVTEALDEADLNECMGQSPEDLDRLEILLLKEISYYAPEIGLGAATKIASGIVSAGYRKH